MPAPVYDSILDAEINPEEPVTSSLKYRLRDNAESMAGGGVNAPHLAPSRIARFITAGDHTWTVPDGVFRIKVTGIGGGGSGGNNANTPQEGGAGGGSGAYFIAVIQVEPSEQYQWTIGAGGAAQTSGGTNGNAGADTYFRLLGEAVESLRAGGGAGGPVRVPGGAGGTAYVPGAMATLTLVGDSLVCPGASGLRGFQEDIYAAAIASTAGAGGSSLLGRGGPEVSENVGVAGQFGAGGSGGGGGGADSGAGGTGIGIIEY